MISFLKEMPFSYCTTQNDYLYTLIYKKTKKAISPLNYTKRLIAHIDWQKNEKGKIVMFMHFTTENYKFSQKKSHLAIELFKTTISTHWLTKKRKQVKLCYLYISRLKMIRFLKTMLFNHWTTQNDYLYTLIDKK